MAIIVLIVFTTLAYSWLVKVSTLVHLNHSYIAVLTPGAMSHTRSNSLAWTDHFFSFSFGREKKGSGPVRIPTLVLKIPVVAGINSMRAS